VEVVVGAVEVVAGGLDEAGAEVLGDGVLLGDV
jgi:hypothetical protein